MPRSLPITIGEHYLTKVCGYALALEVFKGRHPKVLVLFEDTNTITLVDKRSLLLGAVSDKNRRVVYNIGYIGYGTYRSAGRDRKAYSVWSDMLTRCYSEDETRFSNYSDVKVCKEWHNYQNFAKWFYDHYTEGYSLDKDLKVLGNKVYGPETCTFVPLRVNSFMTSSSKGGVTYCKGAWNAQCAYKIGEDKNNTYLGRYSNKEEAKLAYKAFKTSLVYKLKDAYPDVIDDTILNNIKKMIEIC